MLRSHSYLLERLKVGSTNPWYPGDNAENEPGSLGLGPIVYVTIAFYFLKIYAIHLLASYEEQMRIQM